MCFLPKFPEEVFFKKECLQAAAYTRWLTRGKCVKYTHEHRHEVFDALEELSDSSDITTRFEAQGILRQLKTFENVSSKRLPRHILQQ